MILVRNFNTYLHLAKFNFGGEIEYVKIDDKKVSALGSYDKLGGKFLSLYSYRGQNYLRLDSEDYIFGDLRIKHKSKFGKSKLIIIKNGEQVANIRYRIKLDIRDLFSSFFDFGWPVEAEDLDYGLFIYNISKSTERQEILLNPESDN